MSTVSKTKLESSLLSVEVIQAFAESVNYTIGTMTSLNLSSATPLIGVQPIQMDIAGVVGITSDDNRGSLILSFSKSAILEIHNQILGEVEAVLTPAVADIVGEMANMIYGSSKSKLNKIGYNFQMSIPTIVIGNFKFYRKTETSTVTIPFAINEQHKFNVTISAE